MEVFKKFGYRDNRNKNRLYFLLKDVGVKDFVEAIKEEAGLEFNSAGVTMVQSKNIALGSIGVLALKIGNHYWLIRIYWFPFWELFRWEGGFLIRKVRPKNRQRKFGLPGKLIQGLTLLDPNYFIIR